MLSTWKNKRDIPKLMFATFFLEYGAFKIC